MVYFDEV